MTSVSISTNEKSIDFGPNGPFPPIWNRGNNKSKAEIKIDFIVPKRIITVGAIKQTICVITLAIIIWKQIV